MTALADHYTTAVEAGMSAGWRDRAACKGRGTLMDPPRDAVTPEREREAKEICWACPVYEDCQASVLRLSNEADPGGVCGGLTEEERRKVRRRRHWEARKALAAREPSEQDAGPSVEASKRCPRCDEVKPTAFFYRNRTTADGLSTYCKGCSRAAMADSRKSRKIATPPELTCRKCKRTKPADQFGRDASRSTGKTAACKICNAEAARTRQARLKKEKIA